MKHGLLFLLIILSFLGCQDVEKPEKPENLIPKDKMTNILTEAYLSNAARSVSNQTIIDKGIKMDTLIYKNFGVDSILFAKSNAYYAADVNSYREIIETVEKRLIAMQNEMDSIRNQEKNKDTTEVVEKAKAKLLAEPEVD